MGAQTFDPDMSEAQLNQVTDSHHDILASTLGRSAMGFISGHMPLLYPRAAVCVTSFIMTN